MPTYAIKAPNGKTYQIQGPAGASDDDVRSQVLKQFPEAGQAPKAAPVAKPNALRPNDASKVYQDARAAIQKRIAHLPAEAQRVGLARFDADPRIQGIRQAAGLTKLRTRKEEIRDMARATVAEERARGVPDFALALKGSITRSLFGIPERLAAAGLKVTGQAGDLSYDETLDAVRARTDEELAGSTSGNILGQIMGSFAGGGVVGNSVKRAGAKLATSGAPIAAKVGNFLQKAVTLEKGQKVRNVVKVVGAGAAGGAAQAAGEGSDIVEGAEYGAAAPLVLGAGLKGTKQLLKLTRQATRPLSRSVSKAIQEVIGEAPDDLAVRHAQISGQVGENVPLVAALKDADFKAVTDRVLKRSPEATEIAKGHTSKYVRGFMDRMLGHVNAAGKVGDAQVTSIGDLAQLRTDTADELMKPIAGKTVDLTLIPLDDLERQMTKQIGSRIVGLAPKINNALRDLRPDDLEGMGLDASDVSNARRLMTEWGMGKPVEATVKEMDSLRRALNAAANSAQNGNPANAMALRNASKAIQDFVTEAHPEYGQMVDTYAAQSRMMEGFETAAKGTRVTDVADDLLRNNLRTPEGRVGMKAGELFRQREAVTARPTSAISAARDYAAEGKLTRPASLDPGAAQPGTITENLGDQAAAGLANAAKGETQVFGRMLDTEKLNALAKNEEGALSPEEIVYGAFLGNALASTKARFLATLIDKLPRGFNKKVANNMADMLFSQDAAATQKALAALRKVGIADQALSKLMSNALPASFAAGALAGGDGAPDAPPDPEAELDLSDAPSVEADLAGLEQPDAGGEMFMAVDNPEGLLEAGNLDLNARPVVTNQDGSISTVRSITAGFDDGFYLLPTVIGDKVVSDEEAIEHFKQTGEHLGKFSSEEAADNYAEQLHEQQDAMYAPEEGQDQSQLPYGHQVISELFPEAEITEDNRDPNSKLGRANPGSYHNRTENAVDLRPIPGMTFSEFIGQIKEAGYDVIEAIDEVNHPTKHATGPHWHVVVA